LRTIYEPFNISRRVIGFDTFDGFPSVHKKQLEAFLKSCPETIVALAYFDLDIYEPTKRCLELLKPFVTKGTVMAFDELNLPHSPGETLALKEVYGLDKIRLRRSRDYSGQPSYFIVE
jgi:hypothetical protein